VGCIVAQVEVTNPTDFEKSLVFSAFVDTGAGTLILPSSWKGRLGKFVNEEKVEFVLANNEVVHGIARGPVGIRIEGFRRIFDEIMFMDMEPAENGEYQPLFGYVILEQAQVAIDMLGHRLVPVKYIDYKWHWIAKDSAAACRVTAISSSPWAAERKPASKAEGAR